MKITSKYSMLIKFPIFIVLLILGISNFILADEPVNVNSSSEFSFGIQTSIQDSTVLDTLGQKKKPLYAIYPIIDYSAETGWAGGAGGQIIFGEQFDRYSSTIELQTYYTQKKQYVFEIGTEMYPQNGNYIFSGTIEYSNFLTNFYGIGNDTKKDQKEQYTLQLLSLDPALQKRFSPNFYFGLQLDYQNTNITKIATEGLLDTSFVSGKSGGIFSGVGLNATWDSRDDNIYPTNGCFHQASAIRYGKFSGSEYTFDSYELDLRYYHELKNGQILAFRGIFCNLTGDAPFYVYNQLGKWLRSYTKTRFIDKTLIAGEIEYRHHLIGPLGLITFAGCGQVTDDVQNIALQDLKPGIGLGIRLQMMPDQKINLRFDFGFGKDDSSIEFNILEAF